MQAAGKSTQAAGSALPPQKRIDPASVLNKVQLVTPGDAQAVGAFSCEPCSLRFTSYTAYLDHCNGKAHHKLLGLKVATERVDDVGRIRARLHHLRAVRAAQRAAGRTDAVVLATQRMARQKAEEDERRRQRYAQKRAARREAGQEEAAEASEEARLMASVVGISSFGA